MEFVCLCQGRELRLNVGSVKREVILEITMSIQNANIHGTTVKFSGTECSFPIFLFFTFLFIIQTDSVRKFLVL